MSLLRFSFDPSSITSFTVIYALGIMLMLILMGFIYYYFYLMASSSNSSEPKKEETSSNSSESKKEETSSNSSEPKKEESTSNSSEPKIMVSTSTSSIQKRFKYDVFISFRGVDTRKTIVDHLYDALKDKGVYTYKDDEKIQKGKRISDDLFKSIEDSKFYIIVFSKNYASSSWCLEELVKIMECHKMTGHTAYSIFYDVEPTEVRKQSGAVGQAFAKHEKEEAAGKWREALKEAADLAGWGLNTLEGHEARFIKEIVPQISLELRSIIFGFDENLVGMETRVKDVVSSLEVGIDGVSSISLFSRYAFGRENPLKGYEELSGKVLRYAADLPLTIKVLGSFLCGKDKDEWVDAIERLKKIPLEETLKQLELSYINLEDDYKEIFLDIACILKGQYEEDAIRILECCGYYAKIGLRVLQHRSLITVDEYGRLDMHDHIEEMGKNIVRRSHPKEPNKHSHLWIQEEIEDILANDMGTEATRSLKLDMSRKNWRIVMKGLGKMKKLRYLEVHFDRYGNWESDGEVDDTSLYFPNSLRYLKCIHYPFLYLPKTFQANDLVGLEMESSRRMVQLWEEGEKKVLKRLRFLSLDVTKLTTFDLRMTPNLKMLYMDCSAFRAGQAMGELGDHREL